MVVFIADVWFSSGASCRLVSVSRFSVLSALYILHFSENLAEWPSSSGGHDSFTFELTCITHNSIDCQCFRQLYSYHHVPL